MYLQVYLLIVRPHTMAAWEGFITLTATLALAHDRKQRMHHRSTQSMTATFTRPHRYADGTGACGLRLTHMAYVQAFCSVLPTLHPIQPNPAQPVRWRPRSPSPRDILRDRASFRSIDSAAREDALHAVGFGSISAARELHSLDVELSLKNLRRKVISARSRCASAYARAAARTCSRPRQHSLDSLCRL